MSEEVLAQLERLLSLTEPFKLQMTFEECEEWNEISALVADWREEYDR